jgi:hypothetical protein
MQDATFENQIDQVDSGPLSRRTDGTGAQPPLHTYLAQAVEFGDPFESALHILNCKLVEHALGLHDDLAAVRATLTDPQERLAVNLETTDAVYKISKAVNDHSQLLVRVKSLREEGAPEHHHKTDPSRSASGAPAKNHRRAK